MRLDAALAARGAAASRSEAQRLIDQGLVTVDGQRAAEVPPRGRRRAGGGGARARARPAASRSEVPFEVVWEDEHLMVVDKPAGVVVHPGAGRRHGTLAQALAGRAAGGPDPERAGHRAPPGPRHLRACWWWPSPRPPTRRFSARSATARCTASTWRWWRATPTRAAGRSTRRSAGTATGAPRCPPAPTAPRAAVTHFEVIEELPRTALLEVRLETGRTHQIRAHLAAVGHPICGDARYGGARERPAAWARRASSCTAPNSCLITHSRGNAFCASPNHPPNSIDHSTRPGGSQSPEGQTEADIRGEAVFGPPRFVSGLACVRALKADGAASRPPRAA